MEREFFIRGIGWVLPHSIGSGSEILEQDSWLNSPDQDKLVGFSAKQYLSSVKGYLDPGSSYLLAATALAFNAKNGFDNSLKNEFGACVTTQYGAAQTGYKFFEQFVNKGARFASPLLFPHSYPNTAGNLTAIEFGLAGPHVIFMSNSNSYECLDFSLNQMEKGTATDMLCGVYEATSEKVVPDGTNMLQGSIAIWLSSKASEESLLTINRSDLMECKSLNHGSVKNLLEILTTIK